jgi:hypothetical protein
MNRIREIVFCCSFDLLRLTASRRNAGSPFLVFSLRSFSIALQVLCSCLLAPLEKRLKQFFLIFVLLGKQRCGKSTSVNYLFFAREIKV